MATAATLSELHIFTNFLAQKSATKIPQPYASKMKNGGSVINK